MKNMKVCITDTVLIHKCLIMVVYDRLVHLPHEHSRGGRIFGQ